MAQIINGQVLAEKIKDEVAKEIYDLKGERPSLAIILIGDREDSVLYVNLKEKEAKKVGIDTHIYKCPENISEREIYDTIEFLNKDDSVDAVLIQLPLPEGFDTDGIIRAIDPVKDVDRFHPENVKKLFASCNNKEVVPPLIAVILEILQSIDYDMRGKNICAIINSEIFGRSVKKVLECMGGRVQIAKSSDINLVEKTAKADLLISAVGKAKLVSSDIIKKDAVIIDIGITRDGDKVCGDVDFEDVKNKASFITPVPGGVGPMTIAMLFKNTLDLYKKKHK
ncbi:MAG: Bifunctional protein FolD protein [Parcubacteria group bacterium ADurb.Bin316]|nr:MAG: Bifunctional protein FolD protein [Parcubacteria group bacterium ADurb.Bin316]HOZ55659.1 bifunctional 5,10-methylenetetrahydrofolate dehydrogenase/5,10-methenyltetrahydrofolate cyclohydrolase [bacterium]